MSEGLQTRVLVGPLPIILIAAVVQGWGLYGLHYAIAGQHWPATSTGWLFACYGALLFAPTTLQLLAGYARRRDVRVIVTLVALAYAGFGAHHGNAVFVPLGDQSYTGNDGLFALGVEAVVLWLLLLPFLQTRLAAGRWSLHYPTLFSTSWSNVLLLAEALLFTGLLWLLLVLCAALFRMLGIDFFRELFGEPIFIYPVTALTFGIALHLIGSIDRLTSVVLEQLLNVLKWLAVIAGLILALFTITLVFKLPELLMSGQRAIGAAWLLWLVAVMVLLLNAAYRDGTVARPYPPTIAQALRWVVPLLVIVALTALYALVVRTHSYGLTVDRVWAFIVAGAAFVYAVGYGVTVFDRAGWLPGIARVNVLAALALIVVLGCALTPLASPYRLAANSQFQAAQRLPAPVSENDGNPNSRRDTPFDYLRFSAGRYGVDRLRQLAQVDAGTQSERIHAAARAALARTERWQSSQIEPAEYLAALMMYPDGRTIDAALLEALSTALREGRTFVGFGEESGIGIFIDLNGDGRDEFVLLHPYGGSSFEYRDAGWRELRRFHSSMTVQDWLKMRETVRSGQVEAVSPSWKQLQIGSRRIDVISTR